MYTTTKAYIPSVAAVKGCQAGLLFIAQVESSDVGNGVQVVEYEEFSKYSIGK